MKKRQAGFTVIELIVIVGILIIGLSLLMPLLSGIRAQARKSLCAHNMGMIHQALTMYSVDNSQMYEHYPAYLTNLYTVDPADLSSIKSYINDDRVFICPSDTTKATQNIYNVTALKPIFSISPAVPLDDKHDWAERQVNGLGQRNCSYLYEFSGRISETYIPDDFGGSWNYDLSDFGDTYLVSALDHFSQATPQEIDRDGVPMNDGMGSIGISWQDMKFHQLSDGDVYITGSEDSSFGDFPDPPPGFTDPYDYYFNNNVDPDNIVTHYSRTWMPIVRCFWHVNPATIDSEAIEQVQNLSLEGNVFNSAPYWERTAFRYGPNTGGM